MSNCVKEVLNNNDLTKIMNSYLTTTSIYDFIKNPYNKLGSLRYTNNLKNYIKELSKVSNSYIIKDGKLSLMKNEVKSEFSKKSEIEKNSFISDINYGVNSVTYGQTENDRDERRNLKNELFNAIKYIYYPLKYPFHKAIKDNKLNIVKNLLSDNNANELDMDGKHPLILALEYEFTDIASYLIDKSKIDFKKTCTEKTNALCLAIEKENHKIIKKIINETHFDFYRETYPDSALNVAVRKEDYNTIQLMIKKLNTMTNEFGENLYIHDIYSEGTYPIHVATSCENIDMIKFLKHLDFDLNKPTGDCGMTPIWQAVAVDNTELLKYFLEKGCSLKVKPHGWWKVSSDESKDIITFAKSRNSYKCLVVLYEFLMEKNNIVPQELIH